MTVLPGGTAVGVLDPTEEPNTVLTPTTTPTAVLGQGTGRPVELALSETRTTVLEVT